MKKLTTTLLLAAAVAASVTPAAFAASDEAVNAANALYKQGLFLGNGTNATGAPNFELDRKPTRHEAVTMLVRLLGKEEEAKKGTWNTPFTDVDEWAKPYVGYAYTNKLTTGTSETTFSGNDTVTATEYLTLVLRVLGYDDKKGDFSWDKAWELSDKIGLTKGQYNDATNNFTRGDVAIVSQAAAKKKAETDKKPEDDKKQETEQPKADDQKAEQPSDKDNKPSSSENKPSGTDKDTQQTMNNEESEEEFSLYIGRGCDVFFINGESYEMQFPFSGDNVIGGRVSSKEKHGAQFLLLDDCYLAPKELVRVLMMVTESYTIDKEKHHIIINEPEVTKTKTGHIYDFGSFQYVIERDENNIRRMKIVMGKNSIDFRMGTQKDVDKIELLTKQGVRYVELENNDSVNGKDFLDFLGINKTLRHVFPDMDDKYVSYWEFVE